jgi:hypothetical protein
MAKRNKRGHKRWPELTALAQAEMIPFLIAARDTVRNTYLELIVSVKPEHRTAVASQLQYWRNVESGINWILDAVQKKRPVNGVKANA